MEKIYNSNEDCIDFVVTWVDDTDTEWQAQRNKYAGKNAEDSAVYRFRDWGTLKYLFRWIEKFAPWVNNVFFVTCGHYPSWLNLNHPKLKFIKHEDYIPQEYLPTFNSNAIELNFHRIRELSEYFVCFNDDMFITNYMEKSDFFEKWLPKQIAWLSTIPTTNDIFGHIILNNINLINRHFSYKEILRKNKKKWYHFWYWPRVLVQTIFLQNYPYLVWFFDHHLPSPLLKTTMKNLRDKEFDALNTTSMAKFRTKDDVNHYVFSWYDICSDNFLPKNKNTGRCFTIKGENYIKIIDSINKQKYKMICINDTEHVFDFEKVKSKVITAFEKILPEKSWFEK